MVRRVIAPPGEAWSTSCRNHAAPLAALILLEKAPENSIQLIPPAAAAPLFMAAVPFCPIGIRALLHLAMANLDAILARVPVYRLRCRPERAVIPLVRSVLCYPRPRADASHTSCAEARPTCAIDGQWPQYAGPSFSDGDVVEIAPVPSSLRPGLVVLAHLPGERYLLHRLVAECDAGWLLRGDNCSVADGIVRREHLLAWPRV